LAQRGIFVDYIPESFCVTSLATGLAAIVAPGEKILVLRAREGSVDLNRILDQEDIRYEDVAVYETVYQPDNSIFSKEVILSYDFDYAAFTSASTVKGFVNALPQLDFTKITALCIGEETAKAAGSHGMACILPERATIDSMIDTMTQMQRHTNSD
jgi:uroporphyrinogen III methyltransferase/synthase